MAIDQAGEVLPIPDEFPIDWESPEEERLFFRQARDHFPRPVKQLDFEFFAETAVYGVGKTADYYQGPIVGWHIRRFNTYFYQAMLLYDGPDEEKRTALAEERVLGDMETSLERWQRESMQEILGHIEWWDAFDLGAASNDELTSHFEESWQRSLRLWEIHFMTIVPPYIAMSEFEELYRQLFGEASTLDAFNVLQGFPNKTTEVSQATWDLSRRALASDSVRRAFEHEPSEVISKLKRSKDGRSFLEEFDAFVMEHGQRTTTWLLSAASYVEDPTVVIRNLADLMDRSDDEAPLTTTLQAAQAREQSLAAARDRMRGYPEPVRQQFEYLMQAAQGATMIQDDHNYWIDFASSYRMRRVVLELGRRLAEGGAIAERDDIFLLYREEILESTQRLGDVDWRETVAERKDEIARFEDVDPPRYIGTRPNYLPQDNPVFRFAAKFYGVPPEQPADTGLVQGLPGSRGKARGRARVVRHLDELDRLRPGEVLVAETTAPPWTPVFAIAAAVVTDSGGILSHAAVVSREYGIPAVVGTGHATLRIDDGQTVEVDGLTGTVRVLDQEGDMDGDGRPTAEAVAPPVEVAAPSVDDVPPAEEAQADVPVAASAQTDGRAAASPPTDVPAAASPPTDARHFYTELSARNEEILTDEEQGAVNALSILVAGCGSVGGALVEPLVRIGVGGLVLADPDTYELNNLNRQACTTADVGRLKVEVLAERARSINNFIDVRTVPEGITPQNVEEVVADANVIYEAIDPSPGPLWMKYLVHKHAARQRVPVVTGVDLGGQPTIYVFDYRRDPRPFLGKANVAAFREGRVFEAMIPWVGVLNAPSDFIPVVVSRLNAPPDLGAVAPATEEELRRALDPQWPQVSYTATALGALATRTIIDVAHGRPVPQVLGTDIHMLTRSRGERVRQRVRRPLELARAYRLLRQLQSDPAVGAPAPSFSAAAISARLAALPEPVRTALEAMRLAPSNHNAQPWRLGLRSDDTVRVGFEPIRHPNVGDPEHRYLCHSLGCAIEAASAVTECEFQHASSGDDLSAQGWYAGDLTVGAIKDSGFGHAMGLVRARGTNRFPYATQAVDRRVLRRFEDIGARHGVQVYTMTDKLAMREFSKLAGRTAMAHMADEAYVDELLAWIRFSRAEPDWEELGFTAESLGFGATTRRLLQTMKGTPPVRRAAMRVNLPALMARQTGTVARSSGAFLYLTTRARGPKPWIDGGRAMMAIWLEATRASLAMQPVTFPLDLDQSRAVVTSSFRASLTDHPVVVMRVGRPTTPTPRSLRLPLEQVVELDGST